MESTETPQPIGPVAWRARADDMNWTYIESVETARELIERGWEVEPLVSGRGANICITNELARVVGKIADRHPDRSIEIHWGEQMDESEWIITADNGVEGESYLANDETGLYVAAHDDTLRLAYGLDK